MSTHSRSYILIFAVTALLAQTFSVALGQGLGGYNTGGVSKAILSNGVTVLVRPEPEASVAAVEVFIRLGAADETDFNSGIGHLLAGSILAGTKTRSATKLARLVSEVGGNFHAVWQWNYLEVYAITPPETCEETIGLIADAVLNSKLDRSAVEHSRAAILREARRQSDDPFTQAYAATRRMVHAGTVYDRPFLGNPDKVKAISQQELEQFYNYHLSPDRIVVAVVGNVDPDRVIKKIDVCFGNMKRSSKPAQSDGYSTSASGEVRIEQTAASTYVLMGYPAAGLDDSDYSAMAVANVLLGGNKSSLLFTKLREERGLGYQVGSIYPALRGGSHIVAYLGMDSERSTPELLTDVRKLMLEQVETLRAGDFSDDDLDRARRYLIGSHALKRERTRDRAFYLGWNEAVGLGYQNDFQFPDSVRKVTREDVIRACNRFMREPATVVFAGTQRAN